MNPLLCLTLIGSKESPQETLRSAEALLKLRDSVSALTNSGGESHKVALCHATIMTHPEDLPRDPGWHSLLTFCSSKGIAVMIDPQRHGADHDMLSLLATAINAAAVHRKDIHVLASASATVSPLSAVPPASLWDTAVRLHHAAASCMVFIDQERRIIFARPSILEFPMPRAYFEDTFDHLVDTMALSGRMLCPNRLELVSL